MSREVQSFEIGVVPAGWAIGPIKYLTDVITDGAHISPETEGGIYDFVSTRDVSSSGIDFEGALKTSPETYEYMVKTGCQPKYGDVLFSKDGTVGRTAVVDVNHPFVVASSLIIMRPNPSRLDSRFLNYLCQSAWVQHQVRSFVKGAGLPRLSISNLTRVRGVFPPLPEQQTIASFLNRETAEIDAFIDDQEELVTLLGERRSALITHAVTKGLHRNAPVKSSDVEWFPEIPRHWTMGNVKNLTVKITDGAHISPVTDGGVFDFVSTRDVSASGIDLEGSLKTTPETYDYMVRTGCQPVDGDVLFSKDGTVGRTVVIEGNHPFVIASSLIIIRPNPTALNSRFLDYLCRSNPVQEQVRSYVKGAGLPRLSIANLRKVVGVFPPLAEQCEIADHLDDETAEIDATIADAKEAIELSKEHRAALISAAVTGKIDVG